MLYLYLGFAFISRLVLGVSQLSVISNGVVHPGQIPSGHQASNLSSVSTFGNKTSSSTDSGWTEFAIRTALYKFNGAYNSHVHLSPPESSQNLRRMLSVVRECLISLAQTRTTLPGSKIVIYDPPVRAELDWLDGTAIWTISKSRFALIELDENLPVELRQNFYPVDVTIGSISFPYAETMRLTVQNIPNVRIETMELGNNISIEVSFAVEDRLINKDAERSIGRAIHFYETHEIEERRDDDWFFIRSCYFNVDIKSAPPVGGPLPTEAFIAAVNAVRQSIQDYGGGQWIGFIAIIAQGDFKFGSFSLGLSYLNNPTRV